MTSISPPEGQDKTLLELAARCEAATGPDKFLDMQIFIATAESHFEYHGGDCVLAVQGGFSARLDWKDMPHPTASLDAAMTLVPEGMEWETGSAGWARLRPSGTLDQLDPRVVLVRKAATPALALCAAALRALNQVRAIL